MIHTIRIVLIRLCFSHALRLSSESLGLRSISGLGLEPWSWDRVWQNGLDQFNASKDLALVFTIGKVGSTSIYDSLLKLANGEGQFSSKIQPSYKRILKCHNSQVAADFIKKAPADSKIWVLTSVRQPYTRLPSAFFELIEDGKLNTLNKSTVLAMNNNDLHQAFFDWLPRVYPQPDHFFEDSFRKVIGVNFMDPQPNLISKDGKLIFSSNVLGKDINVVVLRLEDIQQWDDIMSQNFVGWKTGHGQDPGKTWFAQKYKDFVTTLTFPHSIMQKYLQDSAMNFYTDDEKTTWVQQALGEHVTEFEKNDTDLNYFVELNGRTYLMHDFTGLDV